MKYLSFLFLFFVLDAEAQMAVNVQWTEQTSLPANDVIYYRPETRLVWGNFRGRPEEAGRTAAITMSGFGYNASMHASGQAGQIDIKVYCFFNKNKSWVKPGRTTPYILTHEQHHFDVSYIAAHSFIDKIRNAELDRHNYSSVISKLYGESIEEMNRMQDDYDNQTQNGQDREMQDQWNKAIEAKLSALIN